MPKVTDSAQTICRLPAQIVRAIITILAPTVWAPAAQKGIEGARAVEDLRRDGLWGRARLKFEREIK